jgi:UDP-glucose:(heptosyl)LPS alpha-1,3-glucosyltransferase
MKIALVILHADPSRGGAERYTIDLAAVLARRGHDVEIVATTIAKIPPGVRAVQLMARRPTRTWTYGAFLRLLDAHLARNPYDVVHAMLPVRRCDVYHPHAGLAAAAAEDTAPMTLLFNPRRKAMARVERHLLSRDRIPVILSLSNYVGSAIGRYYPNAQGRIEPLFNAVDLDRFSPDPIPAGDTTVRALIIAQDFHRKGVAEAIQALAAVKEARLAVVGGDDPSPFKEVARQAGAADRVHFVGGVADTRPYYREADFFVLPTKHDPCSLVVLESLAMGVPVITTQFNGAAEIMTDGVHGFVLPDPLDTQTLADAMRSMLDPQRRSSMAQACLALRPRLSYEHHLDRLLEIYHRARLHSAAVAGQST